MLLPSLCRAHTLTVTRWAEAGWITVARSERGEMIRAEPFEAIEPRVGMLFGDDPE